MARKSICFLSIPLSVPPFSSAPAAARIYSTVRCAASRVLHLARHLIAYIFLAHVLYTPARGSPKNQCFVCIHINYVSVPFQVSKYWSANGRIMHYLFGLKRNMELGLDLRDHRDGI